MSLKGAKTNAIQEGGSMTQAPKATDRRHLLKGSLALAAGAVLCAPAVVAAQARVVRMISVWGRGFPLVSASAQRLAERLTSVTDGDLRVELFAAGELGSPGEAQARVGAGEAELYHGVEYFWAAKNPAFHLFSGVPFGLTATELLGWLNGPGATHWDTLQAEYNIKPFSAGVLAGGLGFWSNKEIETADDLKGLRIRSSGMARSVLKSLGADARPVSFARLPAALETRALGAAEWFGPWADPDLALTEAAAFVYGPPVLRPALGISAGLNIPFWFSLTDAQRAGFRAVFAAESQRMLLETHRTNARQIAAIRGSALNDKVRQFSPEMLTLIGRRSGDVLAEAMTGNETAETVLTDYLSFRSESYREVLWGESGFMQARELPFTFAR